MMEVDSALAEAAIKCDLNCYANQWRHLQLSKRPPLRFVSNDGDDKDARGVNK